MTVAELLDRVSSKELTEWIIYSKYEPFGQRASYIGTAIVAQTVANVNRKKGSKPYQVEDFMPKFETEPQSVDQMLQIAEAMTAALGGKDLRDGK